MLSILRLIFYEDEFRLNGGYVIPARDRSLLNSYEKVKNYTYGLY